jgi:SAM-dependent MidA family methyltransferase
MQLWRTAMETALYGADGFYRGSRPSDHFRTSVTASSRFAEAIGRLAALTDEALGRPEPFDLVDVGAGDGRLAAQLLASAPAGLAERLRVVAVDLRPRPADLPAEVGWTSSPPDRLTGLVMAHELLDNIVVDVVERSDGLLRQVEVDASGEESLGPPATGEQQAWLDRWWPAIEDGQRAECGSGRDLAWAGLVTALERGVALAVDFGHVAEERTGGRFAAGTMTGYRGGYQVAPVPDGTCDITCHVAMDACAAAGVKAGAQDSVLLRQRDALHFLGVSGALPEPGLAHTRPAEYVRQLSGASEAAELLDPSSLGSFWWLLQGRGVALPAIGSGTLSG